MKTVLLHSHSSLVYTWPVFHYASGQKRSNPFKNKSISEKGPGQQLESRKAGKKSNPHELFRTQFQMKIYSVMAADRPSSRVAEIQ